jgi:hypothetical protein
MPSSRDREQRGFARPVAGQIPVLARAARWPSNLRTAPGEPPLRDGATADQGVAVAVASVAMARAIVMRPPWR